MGGGWKGVQGDATVCGGVGGVGEFKGVYVPCQQGVCGILQFLRFVLNVRPLSAELQVHIWPGRGISGPAGAAAARHCGQVRGGVLGCIRGEGGSVSLWAGGGGEGCRGASEVRAGVCYCGGGVGVSEVRREKQRQREGPAKSDAPLSTAALIARLYLAVGLYWQAH